MCITIFIKPILQPSHAAACVSDQRRSRAAATALGRKGGLKSGKARAAALTQEERTEIAKKAAAARWGTKEQ